ncbi:hypothetical protein ACIRF8_20760 [Streptomyces sp. NPDC102406]|uniref:hypothetical protein n=1 Tax=Streptomyces sp. NPDC102406 TaxID=3366171 RepID=UPI003826BFD2
MTPAEKVEQRLTGRPDSHVPARTLERLTGMAERPLAVGAVRRGPADQRPDPGERDRRRRPTLDLAPP